MEWLAKAQDLGGSALAAGICLWFVRRVSGHEGPIRSSKAVRRKMGLSAGQMLNGLRRLEAGSLVRFVKTGRGRPSSRNHHRPADGGVYVARL